MDRYTSTLEIKKLVEEATGVSDLATTQRTRFVADTRFVYYGLCRRFLKNFTYQGVANSVERDHASVIYGEKQFNILYENKDWFGRYLYNYIVYRLTNESYLVRLKDQLKNKKRKCNRKQFAINK